MLVVWQCIGSGWRLSSVSGCFLAFRCAVFNHMPTINMHPYAFSSACATHTLQHDAPPLKHSPPKSSQQITAWMCMHVDLLPVENPLHSNMPPLQANLSPLTVHVVLLAVGATSVQQAAYRRGYLRRMGHTCLHMWHAGWQHRPRGERGLHKRGQRKRDWWCMAREKRLFFSTC